MRLHDYLNFNARENSEGEFALDSSRALTNAQAAAEANQLATAFVAAGIEVGDRVAMLSKNSVEYAVFYFGASAAGAVPVPLNYRLAPAEWAYIVNDSGARMMIASDEFAEAVDTVRGELGSVEQYRQIGGDPRDGWESYAGWTGGQSAEPCGRLIRDDADAYQMYTSGTTGHPKGAVLQQRAVTSNVTQVVTSGLAFSPGGRALVVAPMYHAAAGIISFSAISGGASLFIQEDFIPPEVVRVMDEEHIASALLVPAMIQACLVIREPEGSRLRSVTNRPRHAEAGDGGVQVRLPAGLRHDRVDRRHLDHVRRRSSAGGHRPTRALAVGRPPDPRLRGAQRRRGRPAAAERRDRRDSRLRTAADSGYWNLPDESASALKGGWMHTGDAGRLDDDGYIYIQDRVKDMIVSGGENVYPDVVEAALFGHPAVADVAVIGVPDEQWGETVKAVVVLRDGESVSAEDLMEFCGDKLGGFERPRSVDFIEVIPRNASGKVLKRELREPYWVGRDRQVS